MGPFSDNPVWPLIRAVAESAAEMAVFPAQDLLGLGEEARMNTPAVAEGNWIWRAPESSWTPEPVSYTHLPRFRPRDRLSMDMAHSLTTRPSALRLPGTPSRMTP